jgi:cation diffusion facilitator CzcD-associated flavoprotein CzcO
MRWVPLAMRLYRANLYWEKESEFSGFHTDSGAGIRQRWSDVAAEYIRKHSPEKYRDFLVPKTEVGCKRRVNDTDYLLSLHRDNVELIYDDPVQEVLEDGVRTRSGREVAADAIVLANGFETQKFLFPMEIRGQNGQSLTDHVSTRCAPRGVESC